METKLKECCLTCEHFYLDTSSVGCYVACGPEERKIACVHMPVCGIYSGNGIVNVTAAPHIFGTDESTKAPVALAEKINEAKNTGGRISFADREVRS